MSEEEIQETDCRDDRVVGQQARTMEGKGSQMVCCLGRDRRAGKGKVIEARKGRRRLVGAGSRGKGWMEYRRVGGKNPNVSCYKKNECV